MVLVQVYGAGVYGLDEVLMAVRVLGVILWGLLVTVAAQDSQIQMPDQSGYDRPMCSPVAGDRCLQRDKILDEYFYIVNGLHHLISFSDGSYYTMKCEAAALGDAALPAFASRKSFRNLTLKGCTPPPTANGSYADALAALNISVFERLALIELPKDTRFTATSFVGLPPLKALELTTYSTDGVIVLEAGVFDPLESLQSLGLVGVRPDRLPPRLDSLRLRYTGLETLPPEALNVVKLEVVEEKLSEIGGPAPRLETLTLSAPVRAPPLAPALRRASLARWRDRAPPVWRHCDRLELLSLTQAAARRLPADFVAACGNLHTLELQLMQAEELPIGFLRNASELVSFKASNWPLKSLPPDLFDYSPKLQEIDLSNNRLESLPSGVFAPVAGSLRTLSLARNRLRNVDVLSVAPLSELRVLNLSNNSLGDLCPATSAHIVSRGWSYLFGLRQLDQLVLSRTGLTRLCADWTHHMHMLSRLDLTHNNIAELQFADLKIQRKVSPADVDVSDNPLRVVHCSREDYELAADDAIPKQTAKLVMDSLLECSCGAYYLARALRERRLGAAFEPRCAAAAADPPGRSILNKPLRSVPLSELVCELPGAECAANCSCRLEPALGGVRAACAGVGDLAPPLARLAARAAPLRWLRAAGVSRLPDRLPPTLEMVDLSDGRIESATDAQARALFAGEARVRLARNPLRCDCRHRELLDALAANHARVIDYANLTCSDNRTVSAALATMSCGARSWALGALAALCCLALAAALAAALVARPETRLRLKAFLHSRGVGTRWLARRLEPADEDRIFDVFVAHATQDQRFVAECLVPLLEGGPRALRLCLDYRDWPAGAWIPTQIEASIRYSRRTVAVVSQHFLSSRWARAQLVAAHAAALRGGGGARVVVVLVGLAPRELDPELRALVAAHGALRWGRAAFWPQLRRALPAPRAPTAAGPPPAVRWPDPPVDAGPPAAA